MSLVICNDPITTVKEFVRVREMLLASCDYGNGTLTEETIIAGLLSREYMLWTSDDSAMLCAYNSVPLADFKSLLIIAAAGKLDDMHKWMPVVVEFAHQNHCNAIESSGRKGWERALAEHGFGFSSLNLIKRI